jgi:hypothetical protein
MCEGEYLRRFGVCSIDKYDRCDVVYEGETPELFWIKLSVRVASDDAINHHEDTCILGAFGELSKSLGPTRHFAPSGEAKVKLLLDALRGFDRVGLKAEGANESQGVGPISPQVAAIPLLSLLA